MDYNLGNVEDKADIKSSSKSTATAEAEAVTKSPKKATAASFKS
jgi:hypothetical protein